MRTRMFMLALVLGSSSRVVLGQVPEPSLPRLRYEAPAACPNQHFFSERMRARLNADGRRALASLSLHVKLDKSATSVRGSVEIVRGSTAAQRSLEGPSCREVVEGLALITALAVAASPAPAKTHLAPVGPRVPAQSTSRARSEAATPAPAAAPPTAAAELDARTAAADRQTQVAPHDELPAAAPRPAETPARPARAIRSGTTPGDDATPADATQPGEDSESDARARWSVTGGLLALHGLAPAIQPGLQLQAAVSFDTGALDWSVRIGGRIALDDTLRSAQGLARFGFVAGLLQLCAAGGFGESGFSLAGCAVAEPGKFSASAEDTRNPRSYSRAWFAAGAGTELGFRVVDWLSLHAGAEALIPARRDRTILAGELLQRVAPVCVRLELGIEVPLG